MVCSTKKKICVSSLVGWALAIVGAVMIPLMEYIIKKKVESTVIIHEGGEVYEYWLDPPVPIYLQIYMFNLTNKEEFLHGDKPSVSQVGPYTYSEKRVKFNVVFNDNGTVSYRQKRTFHFIPDMSVGNETDMFLSPNPVYWALYYGLMYEYSEIREMIYALTELYGEHPLMFRPLKEIIWGYRDPLLNASRAIDPNWFYTDFVGYFMNKNNTDDGVYTVFTGVNNISALGVIDKYNGSSYLNFWTTKWANMVNGTDGTLGPPYLPKDTRLHTFSSDICRSVPGVYYRDVKTSQGIKLWRFGAQPDGLANISVNPDNIGFCTPSKENCFGAGIYNISTCQIVDFFHLPIALSLPHFLFGDPRYIEAVDGIHPNIDEHNPVADLEPYTGLVLQVNKRLQINTYLEPIPNISLWMNFHIEDWCYAILVYLSCLFFNETLGIKPVFLPVFWLNESAAIDEKNAEKFFRMLFTPLLIIHVTEIALISLGLLVIISTVVYGVFKHRQSKQVTKSSGACSEDTQPIVSYDDDITDEETNQDSDPDYSQSDPVI